MHLLVAPRLLLRCLRASLHAAVVVTLSITLFLFFLLWSLLQLVDEQTVGVSASEDSTRVLARSDR
jgi:hypothetical protein